MHYNDIYCIYFISYVYFDLITAKLYAQRGEFDGCLYWPSECVLIALTLTLAVGFIAFAFALGFLLCATSLDGAWWIESSSSSCLLSQPKIH